jgi:sugar lactone lactonase YvrE
MYYIDSPQKEIYCFDYSIEFGTIRNKKVVISLKDEAGIPDGMAIDVEGNLWIAKWGGYMISRWNPNTGQFIESVEVPVPHVTACAFGGDDMSRLYVTTASIDTSCELLKKWPMCGGIFEASTGTRGLPFYKCKYVHEVENGQ